MNPAIALSAGGLASVLVGWSTYLAKVYKNAAPRRPIGGILLEAGGSAAAIAGIVYSFRGGGSPGVAVIAPAALALMMGPLFLFLLTQRKTPLGDIQVKVGDPLLPFAATTSDGEAFHSDALLGQRTLLKFFRGGW